MILSFYLFIHSFIYINTPLGEMIPGEMQLSITFHIFFFFFFFFFKNLIICNKNLNICLFFINIIYFEAKRLIF